MEILSACINIIARKFLHLPTSAQLKDTMYVALISINVWEIPYLSVLNRVLSKYTRLAILASKAFLKGNNTYTSKKATFSGIRSVDLWFGSPILYPTLN